MIRKEVLQALERAEGLKIEELKLLRFALAIRIIVRLLQGRS